MMRLARRRFRWSLPGLLAGVFALGGCGSDGDSAAWGGPSDAGTGGDAQPEGGAGCVARTCAQLSAECGQAPDGCGGVVSCGVCPQGLFCGGEGPNQCGTTPCTPSTCVALQAECGTLSDGCGTALDCGVCQGNQTCGTSGAEANKCSVTTCTPGTCEAFGAECGKLMDGCGGIIDCGVCSPGLSCGSETPYRCGTGTCIPTTCAAQSACQPIHDGCGGILDCSAPVQGGWTEWTCKTGCGACGSGTKECTRTCTNPAPSCGGADCTGDSSDEISCSVYTPQPFQLAAGTEASFDVCGENRLAVVPAGITQVTFGVWGGGGGGGSPGRGGGGAYVGGTLSVQQGDTIEVRVACGGRTSGGGGGASYVLHNGQIVMVAAGGGGGGVDGCTGCSKESNLFAGRGGAGGPAAVGGLSGVGQDGADNNYVNTGSGGGKGGTQTAGGAGGVSNNTSAYSGCTTSGFAGSSNRGGAHSTSKCEAGTAAHNEWTSCSSGSNGASGGGGVGVFGGGSGAAMYTYTGGGGGGGASWVSASVLSPVSEGGSWDVPGGIGAAGYNGTAGQGGKGHDNTSVMTTGVPGRVHIQM